MTTDAMNSERLIELAERCERAKGPSYALECEIWDAVYPGERDERFRKLTESGPYKGRLGPADKDGYVKPFRSFTASIDAAMTLVPDGYFWTLGGNVHHGHWIASINMLNSEGQPWCIACGNAAATPALALTAAALRALAEKKG
ncbi:MAG: hypothetical protein PHE36_04400 [Novosphingobium sp.]|nr:hypothetical protein [Novosphingobium sp.]